MKINWRQKLTSRKFWAAVIGFVTALLVFYNVDEITIERIATLISAEGVLIAYMFAEGDVDAAREDKIEIKSKDGDE